MLHVKAKRSFHGAEGEVRVGQEITVSDARGKSLEKKGLVDVIGAVKEAEDPQNKKAQEPANKDGKGGGKKAQEPANKDGKGGGKKAQEPA